MLNWSSDIRIYLPCTQHFFSNNGMINNTMYKIYFGVELGPAYSGMVLSGLLRWRGNGAAWITISSSCSCVKLKGDNSLSDICRLRILSCLVRAFKIGREYDCVKDPGMLTTGSSCSTIIGCCDSEAEPGRLTEWALWWFEYEPFWTCSYSSSSSLQGDGCLCVLLVINSVCFSFSFSIVLFFSSLIFVL